MVHALHELRPFSLHKYKEIILRTIFELPSMSGNGSRTISRKFLKKMCIFTTNRCILEKYFFLYGAVGSIGS